MANRVLQLKRNTSIFASRAAAISGVDVLNLVNGEAILATYVDSNATNGKADILVIKSQNKLFYADPQEVLDKLGAKYGEAISFNGRDISGSTTFKNAIEKLESVIIENETAFEGELDGLSATSVSGESKVVVDVTQNKGKITATASNLSGVKLDGYGTTSDSKVAATDTLGQAIGKLQGQIDAMDKTASAENGKVVTTVSETDGKVSETKANVKDLQLGGYVRGSESGSISSNDTINVALSKLENLVASSGGAIDANIAVLSAKTLTTVIDSESVDLTIGNASDGTKSVKADVKTSASGSSASFNENIIKVVTDGVYAAVDYNPTKNALVVNGVEKVLNAGSIIDSIEYSASTESLVINYRDTSGGTHSTSAPLGDLIDEYDFKASDATHNVTFTTTRHTSGATTVQAEVSLFDCGEY